MSAGFFLRRNYSVLYRFKTTSVFIKRKSCLSYVEITRSLSVSCIQCANNVIKKDVSLSNVPTAYKPNEVEDAWYDWWESKGYFEPSTQGKPFTLILPPPNVTGALHLGHALTGTIEDIIVRWKRMKGESTLWIPGTDHAGIATQVVVEKQLWNKSKKTKHDLGRDAFVEHVSHWKTEKASEIKQQLRRMGFSLDWRKHVFTMDPRSCDAVTEAFIRLFDAGLIRRENALVSWSCALQSSISDIEVEYSDVPGRTMLTLPGCKEPVEFGVLTEIAYRLHEHDGEVVVATTRPETVLGDTAVALHPDDPRRADLEGKSVWHPFQSRPIPIIFDPFVDPSFGTGAVKITPAHDPNDWQVARRHNLESVKVFDESGVIVTPKFKGKQRYEARKMVVGQLKNIGLLRGSKSHPMQIPICSRSRDVVELVERPQWFLDCKNAAAEAVDALRKGDLTFDPPVYDKNWYHWLENIRSWNISRQLWWGHRIPAFEVSTGERKIWVAARGEVEARQKGAAELGVKIEEISGVRQEEDVLDTWFSSGVFPLYCLGWPKDTAEFRERYPISLLDTGHDILFYWVARMVMMGKMLTGELPFRKVLLHGTIMDARGRKMSKSLGNVISPDSVINGASLQELEAGIRESREKGLLSDAELKASLKEQKKLFPAGIPKCGADALRFTLCSQAVQNNVMSFDIATCNTNKMFCNKILQAFRFFIGSLEGETPSRHLEKSKLRGFDGWILSKLSTCVTSVETSFDRHEFHMAASALRQFLYSELCDVYLEAVKPILRYEDPSRRAAALSVLFNCFEISLRLLHPIMPYLTEDLYQRLPKLYDFSPAESIMIAPFPTPEDCAVWSNRDLEEVVESVNDVVSAIRKSRSLCGSAAVKPNVLIVTSDSKLSSFIEAHVPEIKSISKAGMFTVKTTASSDDQSNCLKEVLNDRTTVFTSIERTIDAEKLAPTFKRGEKIQGQIQKIRNLIARNDYMDKTTLEMRNRDADKIRHLQSELLKIEEIKKLVK